jgi:hypothetical protein
VVASVNASPASAERLIFCRRAETDHDHSTNAIAGAPARPLFNRQMDDVHIAGLQLRNNYRQQLNRIFWLSIVGGARTSF